jgi:hypothetical protein
MKRMAIRRWETTVSWVIGWLLFNGMLSVYGLPMWTHQHGLVFWVSTAMLFVFWLVGMKIVEVILFFYGLLKGN